MAKPFGIIFGSPLHWVELDARTGIDHFGDTPIFA
jgi:hypothetical protein